jgi:hypothetical protein
VRHIASVTAKMRGHVTPISRAGGACASPVARREA